MGGAVLVFSQKNWNLTFSWLCREKSKIIFLHQRTPIFGRLFTNNFTKYWRPQIQQFLIFFNQVLRKFDYSNIFVGKTVPLPQFFITHLNFQLYSTKTYFLEKYMYFEIYPRKMVLLYPRSSASTAITPTDEVVQKR